ncbi:hypothetical protein NDU88_005544 [Pleurodeles waltl]|uniref:Uncharacterized protein n=1 Tax=Pleurodeles waltl TaxID=8319 RepID=A0AAV7MEX9_PLEWA|nr:hypothetical protein NDU88_005544 [Pleurodeles waltl]
MLTWTGESYLSDLHCARSPGQTGARSKPIERRLKMEGVGLRAREERTASQTGHFGKSGNAVVISAEEELVSAREGRAGAAYTGYKKALHAEAVNGRLCRICWYPDGVLRGQVCTGDMHGHWRVIQGSVASS